MNARIFNALSLGLAFLLVMEASASSKPPNLDVVTGEERKHTEAPLIPVADSGSGTSAPHVAAPKEATAPGAREFEAKRFMMITSREMADNAVCPPSEGLPAKADGHVGYVQIFLLRALTDYKNLILKNELMGIKTNPEEFMAATSMRVKEHLQNQSMDSDKVIAAVNKSLSDLLSPLVKGMNKRFENLAALKASNISLYEVQLEEAKKQNLKNFIKGAFAGDSKAADAHWTNPWANYERNSWAHMFKSLKAMPEVCSGPKSLITKEMNHSRFLHSDISKAQEVRKGIAVNKAGSSKSRVVNKTKEAPKDKLTTKQEKATEKKTPKIVPVSVSGTGTVAPKVAPTAEELPPITPSAPKKAGEGSPPKNKDPIVTNSRGEERRQTSWGAEYPLRSKDGREYLSFDDFQADAYDAGP